ncbi:MAG: hypothetical protein IH899_18845, partial [Planctomycetes bacterium]|nr:hypothetical protein [Planctomycetota bacterium]
MTSKIKDTQFAEKKYVTVFFTKPDCPLRYTDLLTYCYRAYQACFDCIPSHRRTAKSTGLKEETVAKAAVRLRDHGLLAGDSSVISPCPQIEWFQELDALREQFADDHWSRWLRNWRSYVRKPGGDNSLQVSDVLIYSLLRNSKLQDWKPQHGWSHEYLALATRTTAETVSKSLSNLEKTGFIKIEEGMVFRLYKLREGQLRCFADKQAFSGSGSAEPDSYIDEFSAASEIIERTDRAKTKFLKWLNNGWPISDWWKQKIYEKVTQQPKWQDEWFELANRIMSKAMDRPDWN